MATLSKSEIFAADDLKTEIVSVPEWGGEVIVSMMSGTARDAYEGLIFKAGKDGKQQPDTENIRAKLLVATVVDENGELLFSMADIERLGKKSVNALDRVAEVAQRLNAVTDSDLEELAKNS